MLYFLCFLNGVILTIICGLEYQRYKKSKEIHVDESEADLRFINQWDNFMNYNGTAEGQKDINEH